MIAVYYWDKTFDLKSHRRFIGKCGQNCFFMRLKQVDALLDYTVTASATSERPLGQMTSAAL
jgi:hypothetical protein